MAIDPLNIKGWMFPEELNWLTTRASESRSLIIEIGIWYGRSTAALCNGAKGKVIAIDTFEGTPGELATYPPWEVNECERVARENLKEYIESGRLTIIKNHSDRVFNMQFEPPQADLVFIDGDHSHEQVMKDILHYTPLLRSGGIISGHDIHLSGVVRAVEACFGICGKDWFRGPNSIWWKRLEN